MSWRTSGHNYAKRQSEAADIRNSESESLNPNLQSQNMQTILTIPFDHMAYDPMHQNSEMQELHRNRQYSKFWIIHYGLLDPKIPY